METPWTRWAVLEGIMKVLSKVLVKSVGMTALSLTGATLSILVVGVIQMSGGIFVARQRKGNTPPSTPPQILAAIAFGVVATAMSIIVVYVFVSPDADMGVCTFLISMSIIPGAFTDRIFYRDRLSARQWFGIGLFLCAGYAILGFPSLSELTRLPLWVGLSISLAFLAVVNEAITRQAKGMDPFRWNAWIGGTTIAASAITLAAIGDDGWNTAEAMPVSFWLTSAMIGLIVIAQVSFKVLTYTSGGSIALKKLVMFSTYLGGAAVAGVIVYAEPLTLGKAVGLIGFPIAFTVTDKTTWKFVYSHLVARRYAQP